MAYNPSSGTVASATWSVRDFFFARQWRGRPYLISPFCDVAMAGGLAMITFIALFLVVPRHATDFDARQAVVVAMMGWLAYLLNDPHFMVSYQLLYRQYPQKLRRFRDKPPIWRRYILAGMIVPVVLGGYFLVAISTQSMAMFSYAISAMMILVGWHYVKQAFGIFMMLSAMKKIFYTSRQRFLLLFNSYIAWLCYSVVSLTDPSAGQTVAKTLWGVSYTGTYVISVPESFTAAIGIVFILCAMMSVAVMIWDNKKPSFSAMIAYLSMYYLLFAGAFHPLWIVIYPAFHSLQYLMFVCAYKRGETQISLSQAETAERRRKIKSNLGRFALLTVILGILFFSAIPGALESSVNPGKTFFFPLTAAFILFINIHHYFIDNVIWRREHAEISQYLFYLPRPKENV